ncbi:MAG TPA: hypothetical protein VMV92_18840 [Streptosporangiaceae bacterium]|nr:hypothetical protein [Streptosporangiaceae bacterium]
MSGQAPEQVTVRLDWSDVRVTPAQHVNQALGQLGPPTNGIPDGIYLTLGRVEPEVILDQEGRASVIEQLKETGAKVGVHGRFHLTRQLVDEVIRILQVTAAQYDTAVRSTEQVQAEGQAAADVDH